MTNINLYTPIIDEVAANYITSINEAKEDINIIMNSIGGSVFAGWGMAAAMSDSKNKITVKVGGVAASMAAFLLFFADEVEALDVSRIMIHRAAGRVETDEDQALLDSMNAQIREKMEERLDPIKFEAITGVSVNSIFEDTKRKEIWLTGKEAKQVGLVTKLTRLTTKEQTAMGRMVADSEFAAKLGLVEEDVNAVSFKEWGFSELSNNIKI